MKKIFRYLAAKLRLNRGCDAPFKAANAIEHSASLDTNYKPIVYTGCGLPTPLEFESTLKKIFELHKKLQKPQKAWWEDVHTMD